MKSTFVLRKIGIVTATLLLLLCFAVPAAAAPIDITVNGEALQTDVAPAIINNRTLVPMRAICERLGATVNYYADTQSISVQKGSVSLQLYLGKAEALLNGKQVALDVPPEVIEQRTMLPLRFLGESLNCQVNWLAESNMVSVEAILEPIPAPNLSAQLLTLINSKRQALKLKPLVRAAVLDNMAAVIMTENAAAGTVSHISPVNGDIAKRSAAFGLANINELMSKGSYDLQSIWEEWLADASFKELLYSNDIYLCGIYVCYAPDKGADDLYVCLELARGDGFFTDSRSGMTSGGRALLSGYVYAPNTCLTVYQLNPQNAELYISRNSYYINPAADYSFMLEIPLAAGGSYAVYLGNDCLYINSR